MEIILDPTINDNFLSKEQLHEYAVDLVPKYEEHVTEENASRLLSEYGAAGNLIVDNLDQHFLINLISHFCLQKVMSDGFGRSIFHIAGEISRLNAEVSDILDYNPALLINSPWSYVFVTDKSARWIPWETNFSCPTIDQSERAFSTDNRTNWAWNYTSNHNVWERHTLPTQLEGEAERGTIKKLDMPLILNSGREVKWDGITPYYIRREQATPVAAEVDPSLSFVLAF